MLDVLNKDYIRAARTKGVKERDVIYRHALKNALIPATTAIGLIFGAILAGAIIVESVFAWNGIGFFIWRAIYGMDLPAVMGMTLVITIVYTVINLLVDLVYGYLDPRIKYG
jgi:ABC-type dipeptide/oligopeptide/nickel transport system permease component